MKNLFEAIPEALPDELAEVIGGHGNLRIERIVSHGHCSPEGFWYDQDEDEFVLLIDGAAELEFEDETVSFKKGDYLTISAHRKHRVKWTPPDQVTIWLVIFFG